MMLLKDAKLVTRGGSICDTKGSGTKLNPILLADSTTYVFAKGILVW